MNRFFHITAVLVSGPNQPQGDPGQVLTLHVPLTSDAQLDAATISDAGERVTVELATSGHILWSARLTVFDDRWAVRFSGGEEGPLWQLDARVLRPGEYLTLYPENHGDQSYRIVNVEPG